LETSPAIGSSAIQQGMFHVRVGTVLQSPPNGKHLNFCCIGDDGRYYYCKGDAGQRRIRGIEWFASSLAGHVGLPVADFSVLEDGSGETFFGSKAPQRCISSRFELEHYFASVGCDELGGPSQWLGQYLSRLRAFDHFIMNPDRDLQNLILDQDGNPSIIKAIDFADSQIVPFPGEKTLIENVQSVRVGRLWRSNFGTHKSAAFEMLDRLGAIPKSTIEGIIGQMPDDWLSDDQAGDLSEVWSDGRCQRRIAKLKSLIEHEW